MRSLISTRLVCAIITVLFSCVNCFAKIAPVLPAPKTSTKDTVKRGLRALTAWDTREVSAPFFKSTAQTPLPASRFNNLYTFFTFSWVKQLMEVGNKKTLQLSDLWVLDETMQMANASLSLDNQFNIEKSTNNGILHPIWDVGFTYNNLLKDFWYSPLTRAVLKQYKYQLITSGILKFINTLVQFLPSLLIARILRHVDKAASARAMFSGVKMTLVDREGMILALALYGTLCVKTFLENQYFDAIIGIGAAARGAISAAIFRKSLKLSPAGRQNNTVR
jgi:hypothetical protein